ncbi:amidohydrolase/deacetylase family metallohydrolase [Cytobacillus praedii]|uniref:amidohydrolase/deacetylase family metallohydrolase n=1 Tax=Cytobacillus praedii TaxID=1742358 RepID=UPI002E1AD76F|nr:amidohydrolase/deacetylase family metallohydrolase [Cytobacillus praedii]MED3572954.1 amidohydrolase/deacetylase family metallohydrolase [Cytobacillus praedii]
MDERYVLQNAQFVTGHSADIVIENQKIIEITNAWKGVGALKIDCSGLHISSGWIDLHVHAFNELEPYGDQIEEIGIKQGVTTIVDAGSCGSDRIADLSAIKDSFKTNVFAFLNISRIGLSRTDELSNLDWINEEGIMNSLHLFHEFIVGLKVRISKSVVGNNGVEPLRVARDLSKKTSMPLMVHIGSSPPPIDEVISLLEGNDILTHYLNDKPNNLFDSEGNPLQIFLDAIDRGVHLNVGHGTESFSFKVAEMAKTHKIGLHTISTDIYRSNRLNGPVFSLANVLSKFLYLGYPLEEIINAVTINAANWLRKPHLGRIKIGDIANLTLFKVQSSQITLIDSEGDIREAKKEIIPKGVVINGEFLTC